MSTISQIVKSVETMGNAKIEKKQVSALAELIDHSVSQAVAPLRDSIDQLIEDNRRLSEDNKQLAKKVDRLADTVTQLSKTVEQLAGDVKRLEDRQTKFEERTEKRFTAMEERIEKFTQNMNFHIYSTVLLAIIGGAALVHTVAKLFT